jgi:hypothetical protein
VDQNDKPATQAQRAPQGRASRRRAIGVGAVAGGLLLVGAGGAVAAVAAVAPGAVSGVVSTVADAVGIDWSAMPAGYTKEQYEAFWGAGYSPEDVEALNALWHTDSTQTKARAGQLILDHQKVPVAPHPVVESAPTETGPPAADATPLGAYTDAQREAFWGAGYTVEDLTALNALWHTDSITTKARAGQLILDHQKVPVAPHGTPAAAS